MGKQTMTRSIRLLLILAGMLGLILIVFTAGEHGAQFARVADIHVFALAGLAAAAILHWRASKPVGS